MDIKEEGFDLWWESNAIAMMCEEDEALKIWQAAKAQAMPEGFVLVPKEPTKDTLIEIASVCIGDDFANLDEAKELYKAMIGTQEPK